MIFISSIKVNYFNDRLEEVLDHFSKMNKDIGNLIFMFERVKLYIFSNVIYKNDIKIKIVKVTRAEA